MATKTVPAADEATYDLPLVEVVRLSDRKPAEPSAARIREVEARLTARSRFVTIDD